MTAENFIYWLQGFMEIADPSRLDEKEIKVIRDHINLVLTKVTPNNTLSRRYYYTFRSFRRNFRR